MTLFDDWPACRVVRMIGSGHSQPTTSHLRLHLDSGLSTAATASGSITNAVGPIEVPGIGQLDAVVGRAGGSPAGPTDTVAPVAGGRAPEKVIMKKQFLLASDFDQTLSFNDSGIVLSELLGTSGFVEKVAGLSRLNLVQQGGELAYLLLHDPEYRRVRREHLVEVGRRIRLKANIDLLAECLASGIDGHHFEFFVISAAPEEVIQSALEGIVEPSHIFGTRFTYDPASGEIQAIQRVPAGYGKVAVLDALQSRLGVTHDRIVYVGDGSSDVHVMLHVNRRDGLTIAVSETKYIAQIARRTVLSDDALSVLVPVLEEIAGWDATRIRLFFEARGFLIQEWDKVRTDMLTLRATGEVAGAEMGNVEASLV
jgi:HAD superfamily phosphoserine phosphatase-like hydrolase